MKRLVALVSEDYAGLMPELLATRDALMPLGVELQLVDFPSLAAPLPEADAYLLQAISGYYEDYAGFQKLMDHLEHSGKPCINPVKTMRWNSDKRYLRELEAGGIPCLPTLWGDAPTPELLAAAQAKGWHEIVAKPVISAGAFQTIRLPSDDTARWADYCASDARHGGIMLQAFAPEIITEGEWSFIFFGGEFSHALLKKAKSGDYRIQHVHGGSYAHLTPPPALLNHAKNVMHHLPHTSIYARVDGICRDEKLFLMEVELIEPFLYLLPDNRSVQRFAQYLADVIA